MNFQMNQKTMILPMKLFVHIAKVRLRVLRWTMMIMIANVHIAIAILHIREKLLLPTIVSQFLRLKQLS